MSEYGKADIPCIERSKYTIIDQVTDYNSNGYTMNVKMWVLWTYTLHASSSSSSKDVALMNYRNSLMRHENRNSSREAIPIRSQSQSHKRQFNSKPLPNFLRH
jgi:hypothetical protein